MSKQPGDSAVAETQRTLRIYSLYRIVLSALLLAIFLGQRFGKLEAGQNQTLFLIVTGSYFAASLATHFYAGYHNFRLRRRTLFLVFFTVDIVALVLIAHANGGLSIGLSVMLANTVAAASIFYRGRWALLIAAIATIAVIANTYLLLRKDVASEADMISAGLLGTLFFAIAIIIQTLAARIEQTQRFAAQKTKELEHSEFLNKLIVQRMQTGILVVDGNNKVTTINRAAGIMLGVDNSTTKLPIPLMVRIQQWANGENVGFLPFRATVSGPQIQAEFMQLTSETDSGILIFLEDTSRTRQQAQQLKLASLGRLTASIAHEIRNPLGAISHAAQLLQESNDLRAPDARLSDIIQNHAKRMNHIIENVLQLSRRKSTEAERINLQQFLQKFVQSLCEQNPQAVIRCENDDPEAIVPFDPSQLDQVLTAICANGLRYSKQSIGQESLLLCTEFHADSRLTVLDIIDDGPGVSEDNMDQLFEPFYTSEQSGTGLGLFIAKELCESNQARLDYLRTEQGRSCFRLSFAHPERKLRAVEK